MMFKCRLNSAGASQCWCAVFLQVPQQLTACFATIANTRAGLEKQKWGGSMASNSTRLHWSLARNGTPV
jgi:hypothetical protein